jgi:hypothetical protein
MPEATARVRPRSDRRAGRTSPSLAPQDLGTPYATRCLLGRVPDSVAPLRNSPEPRSRSGWYTVAMARMPRGLVRSPLARTLRLVRHGRPVHTRRGKVCRAQPGSRGPRRPRGRLPLEQRARPSSGPRRPLGEGVTVARARRRLVLVSRSRRPKRGLGPSSQTRNHRATARQRCFRGRTRAGVGSRPQAAEARAGAESRRLWHTLIVGAAVGRAGCVWCPRI